MFNGNVAELLDASVASIRRWEKLGIIKPVKRTAPGYNKFTKEDLKAILDYLTKKPNNKIAFSQ